EASRRRTNTPRHGIRRPRTCSPVRRAGGGAKVFGGGGGWGHTLVGHGCAVPNSYSIPEFGRPQACPTASVLVLEPHFLARRVVVACGAAPASRSSCEG